MFFNYFFKMNMFWSYDSKASYKHTLPLPHQRLPRAYKIGENAGASGESRN
ncbi:hypothetical protein NIASO_02400 [Niabella soli DSM 19437]|uniref:Uncharacterized protein n=1 Tax=Niabella soli DSM 19437 TaxID=929713 RepID=W0F263_9BACT|nr:hypothetical protein NIASO_02400 [Niabella soli DSM 19437]